MQLLKLTTNYIDQKRNSKVESLNELGREILNRSWIFLGFQITNIKLDPFQETTGAEV